MQQINDILELDNENEKYVEILNELKMEIRRIRREYFENCNQMDKLVIEEIDKELETLYISLENVLY